YCLSRVVEFPRNSVYGYGHRSPYPMAIKNTHQGFALLIAIIFMSVMLSFGLALAALSYKQETLASSALGSQYAFYAADSALECALYADQQSLTFTPYPSTPPATEPSISCNGTSANALSSSLWTPTEWIITYRIPLDTAAGTPHCADVTIYKYSTAQADGATTRVFSQGYDVSCSTVASPLGARFSSRGMSARY
ncbi:MAG TPA: hypothetical protein VMV38_00775, partial [Candidatus Paceibacterota bacterium]|nr:hypothetical protein [Candidatus Paceibacterota bacterium]